MPLRHSFEQMAANAWSEEDLEHHKEEVRDQIRQTFDAAVKKCETLDELFKLRDLAVSLSGLVAVFSEEKDG